jgi:hypothetical protein
MGRELQCRAKTAGKWIEGKALLENSEIIFRGDLRLKIPFAALKSVVARDGELYLKYGTDTVVLELGAKAEKWAHAILHPKSTVDKLGIKAGATISALNLPGDSTMLDAEKSVAAFSDKKLLEGSDMIFFGATTASDLAAITKLVPSLPARGALWIVYPRGRKEITEIQVLDAGRRSGLVDIKVVSYSASHTALKFVRPKDKR